MKTDIGWTAVYLKIYQAHILSVSSKSLFFKKKSSYNKWGLESYTADSKIGRKQISLTITDFKS